MTTQTTTHYPSWLLDRTHAIHYSPNCNMQFEVRLVGKRGALDNKHRSETEDFLGYGHTLEEAASNARAIKELYNMAGVTK